MENDFVFGDLRSAANVKEDIPLKAGEIAVP
jgi:hypothetical protein